VSIRDDFYSNRSFKSYSSELRLRSFGVSRLNSNLTHRKRVITPEECKAIGAFARVGANPNQRSPDGLTPYEIALCDGHRELAEVLSLAATR